MNINPLTFSPPPLSRLQKGLYLQDRWFAPEFVGLEHVDASRPALYVGNHTLYGTLDGPLMILGLYRHKGIFLRSLGDHVHFKIPGWRTLLVDNGCVPGTPAFCDQLMQAGEHIMVYPGGGREVMKNRGEQYQLIWKNRTGFARMALRHGYDIVPFAAIGADDALDIHYDSNDFRKSLLGRLLQRSGATDRFLRGGDAFMPLASGLGPIPRPEKFYFAFGERISTRELMIQADNPETQWQVREQTAASIYTLLNELFALRTQQQAHWPRWRRTLTRRRPLAQS